MNSRYFFRFPKEFSLAEDETGVYVKEISANSATEKEGILKTGKFKTRSPFKRLQCQDFSSFQKQACIDCKGY